MPPRLSLGVFLRREPFRLRTLTPVRFSVLPPQGSMFFHNVATTFLALSPDGSQLAFVADAPPDALRIWLRPISGLEARVVPGTEGALSVFWSPDGRSLAFFADGKLKRIDLPGGAAVPLCDVPAISAFGTWGSDGTILFATFVGDAIFSVSSAGGTPEAIVTPDPSRGERVVWPSFLPDGKRFLYLSQRPNITGQLMLGERGRAPRPIVSAVSNVQWVDPDYLVFAQEGVLVAQRFDLASERVVGAPISIAEPVDRFLSSGRAMFTTSRNGTIAYHSYANVARLVWVDRTGKEVGTVGAPGDYLNVRLSPDGGTVLFERTKPGIGTWDLWTIDLARGVETRLTSDPGSEAFPVWLPDGRAILFADERYSTGNLNLARKRLDTAVEEPLLPNGTQQRRPIDVSPDGHTLLFTERTARGTVNIFTLPLAGPAHAVSAVRVALQRGGSPLLAGRPRHVLHLGRIGPIRSVRGAVSPDRRQDARLGRNRHRRRPAREARDGATTVVSCSTCRPIAASWRCPFARRRSSRWAAPAPLFALQGRAWVDFARVRGREAVPRRRAAGLCR